MHEQLQWENRTQKKYSYYLMFAFMKECNRRTSLRYLFLVGTGKTSRIIGASFFVYLGRARRRNIWYYWRKQIISKDSYHLPFSIKWFSAKYTISLLDNDAKANEIPQYFLALYFKASSFLIEKCLFSCFNQFYNALHKIEYLWVSLSR